MDPDQHEIGRRTMVVMGKPIPQPRHRATVRGGFVKMYLPSDHPVQAYKKAIIDEARRVKLPMIEGPVRLDILFSFCKKPCRGRQFRISKPDLDNLEKAVMDALTDAGVWSDDAQVVEKHTVKINGLLDATSIFVSSLSFTPLEDQGCRGDPQQ